MFSVTQSVIDQPQGLPLKDSPVILRRVLLVEDNDNDARLARRIIRKYDESIDVAMFTSGEDARDYLQREHWTPQLVLLDLKLPRMNGIEFMKVFHGMNGFDRIPIAVLTGSAGDIATAFEAGASSYILKDEFPSRFAEIVHTLGFD